MPLKHSTETLLLIVLALMMLAAGFAAAVLPTLPGGMLWWGIALVISILYPLSVYPLLKNRRADYAFRAMHFAPFFILFLRLVFDLLSSFFGGFGWVIPWYTWAFGLPAVAIGFIALGVFCLKVLRQRTLRLQLLALTFIAFAAAGIVGEYRGWDTAVSAKLKQNAILALTGGSGATLSSASSSAAFVVMASEGSVASVRPASSSRISQASSRTMSVSSAKQGQSSVKQARSSVKQAVSSQAVVAAGVSSSRSSASSRRSMPLLPVLHRSQSSAARMGMYGPSRLPTSGIGLEGLLVTMAAGYCGLLHHRAKKRRSGG